MKLFKLLLPLLLVVACSGFSLGGAAEETKAEEQSENVELAAEEEGEDEYDEYEYDEEEEEEDEEDGELDELEEDEDEEEEEEEEEEESPSIEEDAPAADPMVA